MRICSSEQGQGLRGQELTLKCTAPDQPQQRLFCCFSVQHSPELRVYVWHYLILSALLSGIRTFVHELKGTIHSSKLLTPPGTQWQVLNTWAV